MSKEQKFMICEMVQNNKCYIYCSHAVSHKAKDFSEIVKDEGCLCTTPSHCSLFDKPVKCIPVK